MSKLVFPRHLGHIREASLTRFRNFRSNEEKRILINVNGKIIIFKAINNFLSLDTSIHVIILSVR